MSLSTIRRWLAPYLAWRSRQKRYAAIPGLRDIDVEIATCRRRHRPVRSLERRRRDLIHCALVPSRPSQEASRG